MLPSCHSIHRNSNIINPDSPFPIYENKKGGGRQDRHVMVNTATNHRRHEFCFSLADLRSAGAVAATRELDNMARQPREQRHA